ncbi:hypothetical protein, partial [Staphylococcus epidermidis]|uniref:hypothetical protein n=1 Tax=Staphylococcus epidermidis TaxID=1282 RepID=UPI000C47FB21
TTALTLPAVTLVMMPTPTSPELATVMADPVRVSPRTAGVPGMPGMVKPGIAVEKLGVQPKKGTQNDPI